MSGPAQEKRVAAGVLLGLLGAPACTGSRPSPSPTSTVGAWALEYGTSNMRASHVLPDPTATHRVPVSWQVWLLRQGDRVVLIDTGIGDSALAEKWGIADYRSLSELTVNGVPLDLSTITDVVLTHLHWDHVGGVAELPQARVWVQHDELEWMRQRVDAAHPERSGMRWTDLQHLDTIAAQGRLEVVRGNHDLTPWLHLHRSGGHTPGVQWVSAEVAGQSLVFASDTAYLAANLSEGAPAGSRDAAADGKAYDQMRALQPMFVVPGHEPTLAGLPSADLLTTPE